MFFNLSSKNYREEKVNNMEIIKSIGANMIKKDKEDIVYLLGKNSDESKMYYDELYIVISDGESGKDITIKIECASVYNPKIYINDFNDDGLDEVLFVSEQGDSEGYKNAYIYSYKDSCLEEIFNLERINSENIYTVEYKNSYIVEVKDEIDDKKYLIDISLKDKKYLNEIYNDKKLVKKNIRGEVLSVGGIYTVDIDNDNVLEVLIVQRIIGLYNKDTLGYINSVIKFDKEGFRSIRKSLSIDGESQGCSRNCEDVKDRLIKNKLSIDFSKINFIEGEKIKDYKIERALEKEFGIKSGVDKVSYLYNKVDLNNNRNNEVIVYLEGSKFCIENGCTVVILKDMGKNYSVISKIIGARNPIIVSDEKTNGFKNIIIKVDSRNGEPIYNELKFNGNSYPLNPVNEPRVRRGEKIRGMAFIADDLFYVKGIEF